MTHEQQNEIKESLVSIGFNQGFNDFGDWTFTKGELEIVFGNKKDFLICKRNGRSVLSKTSQTFDEIKTLINNFLA